MNTSLYDFCAIWIPRLQGVSHPCPAGQPATKRRHWRGGLENTPLLKSCMAEDSACRHPSSALALTQTLVSTASAFTPSPVNCRSLLRKPIAHHATQQTDQRGRRRMTNTSTLNGVERGLAELLRNGQAVTLTAVAANPPGPYHSLPGRPCSGCPRGEPVTAPPPAGPRSAGPSTVAKQARTRAGHHDLDRADLPPPATATTAGKSRAQRYEQSTGPRSQRLRPESQNEGQSPVHPAGPTVRRGKKSPATSGASQFCLMVSSVTWPRATFFEDWVCGQRSRPAVWVRCCERRGTLQSL